MKMEYVERQQKYDCLLFDLDDTLYPVSAGLAAAVLNNIKDYMTEKLGINSEKIPELCNLLYKNYGTTMAGIRAIGYDFDYDEYHSFVHGRLPYENLKPDPVLRSLLLSLPIPKFIFTNADKIHAAKVVSKLGLEGCFEGMICFETLNDHPVVHKIKIINKTSPIFDIIAHFSTTSSSSEVELPNTPIVCKPSEDAIQKALNILGANPQTTVRPSLFFEDSVRNIQSGKRVGLDTVLVGNSHRCKGADYALESIHNMKEAIPELWEAAAAAAAAYNSLLETPTPVTA
ncbi:hypothetical protein SSX86_007411 [Deinandra increscens subsp. villosa]|uniref:Pyrimidine 5-nucleotidase n=1 Tax=Deinandra increscens subsp. villosa TaxID=3103831 RepID=A0AAP0DL47_9ASTR